MTNHDISVASDHRQVGQTTMLLDVALANARRGLRVEFWSPSPGEMRNAWATVRRLLGPADCELVEFVERNGDKTILYRNGGRVSFRDHQRSSRLAALGADMLINDGRFGGGITRPKAAIREPRSRRMEFI